MTKQQIDCIFKRFNENYGLNVTSSEPTIDDPQIIHQQKSATKIKWMNTESEWRVNDNVKRQKIIILFTYHRSGSSFTGQLLNQHPGRFSKIKIKSHQTDYHECCFRDFLFVRATYSWHGGRAK